jgi:hypothetical protein
VLGDSSSVTFKRQRSDASSQRRQHSMQTKAGGVLLSLRLACMRLVAITGCGETGEASVNLRIRRLSFTKSSGRVHARPVIDSFTGELGLSAPEPVVE